MKGGTIDATVGTVSAATLLGGLVDLDVLNNASIKIQTLGFSVGFSILQEGQDVFAGLDGPSSLGDGEDLVGLGTATDTTVETTEGDGLLVLNDVIEVAHSLLQGHSLNSHSGFTGVLEVHTEVGTLSLAGLGFILRDKRVTHPKGRKVSI